MVVHSYYNLSVQKTEAGRGIQSHPHLHGEFKAILGVTRPFLKKNNAPKKVWSHSADCPIILQMRFNTDLCLIVFPRAIYSLLFV